MATDVDKLRTWYELLELDLSTQRQIDFLHFVQSWLRRTSNSAQDGFAGPNADRTLRDTLAFLSTYGSRLWPTQAEHRSHLRSTSMIVYALEPPNSPDAPLVQSVRMYFDQAARLPSMQYASSDHDTWDLETLFLKVVAVTDCE